MAKKTMTPSDKPITHGQIDKAVGAYRAMLEKHRIELGSAGAQQVLGQPDYVGELVGVLRRRIAAVSNLIVRKVKVNRTRTAQEALDATGRRQYTDSAVVASMSMAGAEEVEVVFFQPDLSKRGGYISDDDLEKEFALRGLKPADPISVAAVNEADPTFADEYPNGTHWKDERGRWCFAAFGRCDRERAVYVRRRGHGWPDLWWFAGVRK